LRELAPELRGLSADQAGDFLLDSVRRFVRGAPPHDDLSIILLLRTADTPHETNKNQ
jgi:serine phosphatase RsbU (regulator of sigma subunit)